MHKDHKDPQPNHGNDQKGHQDNGNGNGHGRPSRPAKPGESHPSTGTCNNPILKG